MPTIHVDTDVMRQLGTRFDQWCESLRNDMMSQIRNLSGQLENDWQGVSRNHYDQTLNNWEQNVAALLDKGEQLGEHLKNTANRFENADNS